MNFAEKLRALRMEKGMTQAQLAKSAGLSNGAIGNYESGKRKNISYNSIFRIADALGVKPSEIIPIDRCPLCGRQL